MNPPSEPRRSPPRVRQTACGIGQLRPKIAQFGSMVALRRTHCKRTETSRLRSVMQSSRRCGGGSTSAAARPGARDAGEKLGDGCRHSQIAVAKSVRDKLGEARSGRGAAAGRWSSYATITPHRRAPSTTIGAPPPMRGSPRLKIRGGKSRRSLRHSYPYAPDAGLCDQRRHVLPRGSIEREIGNLGAP